MNGAILLSRSLLDSEVFASQKMLKIWIWCLCKANFKDKYTSIKTGRGETTVKVKRGQFLFGRFTAEEELEINGSTIYKIMRKFEEMGNIVIKSNSHYSVITICNYDVYQDIETYKVTTNEQPKDNQVTGKEQPSNTTNKDNKDNKDNKLSFVHFWDLYDKKIGDKTKLEKKWNKLSLADQQKIMQYIPLYKEAQPEKKYRKNVETFLNNKSWNDELISKYDVDGFDKNGIDKDGYRRNGQHYKTGASKYLVV
jgi:hypothetical protein